jgi:hypothetical protein
VAATIADALDGLVEDLAPALIAAPALTSSNCFDLTADRPRRIKPISHRTAAQPAS